MNLGTCPPVSERSFTRNIFFEVTAPEQPMEVAPLLGVRKNSYESFTPLVDGFEASKRLTSGLEGKEYHGIQEKENFGVKGKGSKRRRHKSTPPPDSHKSEKAIANLATKKLEVMSAQNPEADTQQNTFCVKNMVTDFNFTELHIQVTTETPSLDSSATKSAPQSARKTASLLSPSRDTKPKPPDKHEKRPSATPAIRPQKRRSKSFMRSLSSDSQSSSKSGSERSRRPVSRSFSHVTGSSKTAQDAKLPAPSSQNYRRSLQANDSNLETVDSSSTASLSDKRPSRSASAAGISPIGRPQAKKSSKRSKPLSTSAPRSRVKRALSHGKDTLSGIPDRSEYLSEATESNESRSRSLERCGNNGSSYDRATTDNSHRRSSGIRSLFRSLSFRVRSTSNSSSRSASPSPSPSRSPSHSPSRSPRCSPEAINHSSPKETNFLSPLAKSGFRSPSLSLSPPTSPRNNHRSYSPRSPSPTRNTKKPKSRSSSLSPSPAPPIARDHPLKRSSKEQLPKIIKGFPMEIHSDDPSRRSEPEPTSKKRSKSAFGLIPDPKSPPPKHRYHKEQPRSVFDAAPIPQDQPKWTTGVGRGAETGLNAERVKPTTARPATFGCYTPSFGPPLGIYFAGQSRRSPFAGSHSHSTASWHSSLDAFDFISSEDSILSKDDSDETER